MIVITVASLSVNNSNASIHKKYQLISCVAGSYFHGCSAIYYWNRFCPSHISNDDKLSQPKLIAFSHASAKALYPVNKQNSC